MIGLVLGAFLELLVSFYKEKKSERFSPSNNCRTCSKSCLERVNRDENFGESKEIMFKEFLKNQNAKKIAFIALEQNNLSYLKNLKSYLIDETNLNTEIKIITNQYSLEECKNAEFTILFTSLLNSSYEEIKSLKSRFDLLGIVLKGFVLIF